jgi:hypothetical protein
MASNFMPTSLTLNGTARAVAAARPFPRELKIAITAFTVVLIPVYIYAYGIQNFLWFCDLALLITVFALWTENRLLLSMQAVSITVVQTLWIADYVAHYVVGYCPLGIAAYTFGTPSKLLHFLTLFHAWLPLLLIWAVRRVGYDRRAWLYQTLLCWVVLTTCVFFTKQTPTDPDGVNWVFRAWTDNLIQPLSRIVPILRPVYDWSIGLTPDGRQAFHVIGMMVGFTLCLYLPAHLLFVKLVDRSRARRQVSAGTEAGAARRTESVATPS